MRSPLFVFLSGQFERPPSRYEERFSFILDSCPTATWQHGVEISPTLSRETRARAWRKRMNFEFKCPQCGQMVEADESYRGQVAECPYCGKGIVIPRQNPRTGTLRNDSTKKDRAKDSHTINNGQKQRATGFCSNCGNKLNDGENFCGKCGTPRSTAGSPALYSKETETKENVFSSFLKKKGTISGVCTAIFIGVIVFFCIPNSRETISDSRETLPDSQETLEKQISMTVMKMLTENAGFSSFFAIEKAGDCILINTEKNAYSGSVDVYCRWRDDSQKERMQQILLSFSPSSNAGGIEIFTRQLGETQKFKFDVRVMTDGARYSVTCRGAVKQETQAHELVLGMVLTSELRLDEHEPPKVVTHQSKSNDNVNMDSPKERQLHNQHLNENEQVSVHESSEHKSENVEARSMNTGKTISPTVIKNSAGEYDWQSMFQREWPRAFLEIQKTFFVFGGFQLAQPPIDGLALSKDSSRPYIESPFMVQKDVPLQKQYRHFQKADLTFFHGVLIGFTLKAHFAKKYSKASVDRECKTLQDDVVENLKCLDKPVLGISPESTFERNYSENAEWKIKYGQYPNPSKCEIIGYIYTILSFRQDNDGYDLTLSVDAGPHTRPGDGLYTFMALVMEKADYEAGEDLEGSDKKQQSSDASTKEHQHRNRTPESVDSKAEDTETRSAGTETPIPSPTIPAPNEKESSPNSPDESTDPQPQTVTQPNPHFEAARKHDWQRMCQKEWGKAFLEIQKVFSVFGGFQLAQPPIDDVAFDTEDIQKDVPLRKQYRYFQKADLEFVNGALVGFTLKAHFAKTYSKASVERECKAFQDDVVKNLKYLKRPELGIGLGSTFPYHPWRVDYGESRPSAHKIVGMIVTSFLLRQNEDGYDLTLSIDAKRGLGHFIELVVKKEADEAGDELEDFDKKQRGKVGDSPKDDTGQSSAVRTSKPVRITGFGSYKFGQKYLAARMTAEMWQEGGLAIKPVQVRFRKFRTLELGYAIDGKQLCRMRFCAEFPSNTSDGLLNDEVSNIRKELERQFGFEMTERGNEISYEDDKYVVKVWYQSTTKAVYKTKHVGFRNQKVTSTANVKCLYLLLEDKRLMP